MNLKQKMMMEEAKASAELALPDKKLCEHVWSMTISIGKRKSYEVCSKCHAQKHIKKRNKNGK